MEEWMKMPQEARQAEEDKMKAEWGEWMKSTGGKVTETSGAGKTKRVTKEGIADTKNDIMLYAIAETETHEEAAKIFENHPHFGIPGSWIDVMPINKLLGMEGL